MQDHDRVQQVGEDLCTHDEGRNKQHHRQSAVHCFHAPARLDLEEGQSKGRGLYSQDVEGDTQVS